MAPKTPDDESHRLTAPSTSGPTIRRGVLGRELRAARAERARARVPHAAAGLVPDFLAWAQAIPTPRGLPLDFERFPFQPELYRAFADSTVKDVVLMKGTQLGISELLLRLGIYFADTHAGTTFYVFAAAHRLADFTDSRVDALLEHSPYLRRRSGRVWNKGLKQFGPGRCFFRGSQAKNDLLAIDADVLLLDEYDSLNPVNIPEAEQRIGASTLALIRRVGVPSDPESGIAKLYRESDQCQWHVDCAACGEAQVLSFDEHVDWDEDEHGVITNARVVCRVCRRQLDVGRGQWIAAYPGRPRRGYQVNRLMVRGADLRRLIEASKQRMPYHVQSFHNNGLGLPHSDARGGLDRTAVMAAVSAAESFMGGPMTMVAAYRGTSLVTAGVDVASSRPLHVRVSEHLEGLHIPGHRKRALYIGTVADFAELERLFHRFQVDWAVIDASPEERSARAVAERFPGRIYLGRYAERQRDALDLDPERLIITARRSIAFDATIELIRTHQNLLPSDLPRDYIEHMTAPRRHIDKDQYARDKVTYESVGRDDYFHAEVYDLLATEIARAMIAVDARLAHDGELFSLLDELDFEPSNLDRPSMDYHPGPPERDEYDDWYFDW